MASNETQPQGKIAVLGAGSWGCTLASVLAQSGKDIFLWSYDSKQADKLAATHRLEKPLAIDLPLAVKVSSDLKEAVSNAEILLFCCTSQSVREVASNVHSILKANGKQKPTLVNGCKGVEISTFQLMSQVLEAILPGYPVCTLSGPNLAAEMVKNLPTAAVVASKDAHIASFVQSRLSVLTYRLYTNDDIVGVDLAGAVKNIFAIAAGCIDGLALGTNAKSAFLTRALAEMARLGSKLGAKAQTFSGLAGIGDLIATCTSPLSRNYQLGYQMSLGDSVEAAAAKLGAVAEGVPTCQAVWQMSTKLAVDMPIVGQVYELLQGTTTPSGAISNLLQRPLSRE